MTFNSLQYAAFLPVVVLGYWALPGRARRVWLLAASWAFYAAWDWRFLSLLWLSTITDHLVGRALGRTESPRRRRQLVGLSLLVNLGVLAGFKYFDFFVDSARALLEAAGLTTDPVTLSIVLPVGISFYTFQTISYTVDVYRGRIEPCRDPVVFGTYVAFFPQLVAGPIERAQRLLPQLLDEPRRPSQRGVESAVGLILLGLVKKVVVADTVATVASPVFKDPTGRGPAVVALGVVAFAVQIYADFSGYTDIARGSARLFGIDLMENFRAPYLSRHITEFWRRWHISLSTWLRDYLYVPLGGNRRGRLRTYVNLAVVMVLGGLWHGAAWTFVAWGALHGAALAAHRAMRPGAVSDDGPPRGLGQWVGVVVTFAFVCLAWVFFRAPDFSTAADVLAELVTPDPSLPGGEDLLRVGAGLLGLLAVDALRLRPGPTSLRWAEEHAAVSGAAVGLALVALVVHSGATPVPFIYFQF